MPITISYDLQTSDTNQRNYIRSMLERFGWTRLGGSVFRYEGRTTETGSREEDWLNDIIPSLMFLRSYILGKNIQIKFLTLDATSVTRLDHSDSVALFGTEPLSGANLRLQAPTNVQSSEKTIRAFVDEAITATK